MKTFIPHIFLTIVALGVCSVTMAQNKRLTGVILDENGEPLLGITIVDRDSRDGAVSNIEGKFELALSKKVNQVEIAGLGFEKQVIIVDFAGDTQKNLGTVVLKEASMIMEGAVVYGSEVAHIEQKAYTVTAIDAKPLQVRSLDVNQVLGKISGVRIRESGGLGSRFNFSLNGLSGSQIKFFIDDIPMDVMGRAYSLSNFPVNIIERVEVYKGVVPVHLGSDALGGAVNIVSSNQTENFLNTSYSFGSFNTHRASIVGQHRFDQSGLTFSLKGFYNYSDNNYIMRDVDGFVNNKPVAIDAERYHDAYESKMVQAEVGFTNTAWADKLVVGAAYASLSNEVQTGFMITTPFGEVEELEDDYIVDLDYRKEDFLIENLDIKLYTLYSEYDVTTIDSSSYVYDWKGNREENINPTWGEVLRRKSLFEFSQKSILNRVFLNYIITPNQSLKFNYINTHVDRQGENRYQLPEEQAFNSPNTLSKSIMGLAHEINLFNEALSIISALKYYVFDITARDVLYYADNTFAIETLATHVNEPGYSLALRYYFNEELYVKGSFEKGYRIPEADEIFGNGLTIESNPDLNPEESYNINLGGQYTFGLNDDNTVQLGLNTFYRDVRDYIIEKNNGKVNQFENILNVLSKGVELEVKYDWLDKLGVNANLTWQEFINNEEVTEITGRANPVYGFRIPNTPFLFGNLNVNYTFKPILKKLGVSTYYGLSYINKFLLNYDIIASDQNYIPTQVLQNVGVTLKGPKQRHSISIDASNIFDALAYDNYRLQKPGRAFYFKWNYFLK